MDFLSTHWIPKLMKNKHPASATSFGGYCKLAILLTGKVDKPSDVVKVQDTDPCSTIAQQPDAPHSEWDRPINLEENL